MRCSRASRLRSAASSEAARSTARCKAKICFSTDSTARTATRRSTLIRKNAESVDRFTAVSEYYADFMASYLSIPREKIDVVPLGINLEGFERRAARRTRRPFTVGYLASVAPEKGLLALCDAYVRFSQMPGVERRAARSRRLPRARSTKLSEGRRAAADRRRDSAANSSTAARSIAQQKIEFLQRPRRVLGADDLRRAERPVPARGHGVRRAGRAAAARRVPGDAREDVGGLLVDPGDTQSLADGLYRLWKDPALRAELGRERLRRRARALQRRPIGRSDARGVREVDVLKVNGVGKSYPVSRGRRRRAVGCVADTCARRCGRHHGAVGQRKEHAAVHPRRARAADRPAR